MLTLPSGRIRLDSLGRLLIRESGFILSFDAERVNPGTKLTFPDTKISLKDLLSYLRDQYGLTHQMIGNHIILFSDNHTGRQALAKPKVPVKRLYRLKQDNRDQKPAEKQSKAETGFLQLTILPVISIEKPVKFKPVILPTMVEKPSAFRNSAWRGRAAHRTQIAGSEVYSPKDNRRFYASAGLTTSEVLYVNPQIKVGLPWLFASASWETNFKGSGFFYGLGTSVKLPGNRGFQLSASTGALSNDFGWPTSTGDTIGQVKTRLTRIDILGKIHLSRRWTLQFGPVLNFMGSKYSFKDSSRANSFPPPTNVSKDMYILNPPYTLSNNYKENTGSDKKIWIGLQIGLFYTLW